MPKKDQENITIQQSMVSGSVAGASEVLANHPLWTIKTRIQEGKPFTMQPAVLYQGIFYNAASMIPITVIQVGLNHTFQHNFFDNGSSISHGQRLTCAFFAGVSSASISSPTEMIMRRMNIESSFYKTASIMAKNNGWRFLFSGLYATGLREGMFTTFFLAGAPIVKEQLTPYIPHNLLGTVVAGVSSGLAAAYVSHPVDTIKTKQQSQPSASQSLSFCQAATKIYKADGLFGFFKGAVPRGLRVVSGVTIMSGITEHLQDAFQTCNNDTTNIKP